MTGGRLRAGMWGLLPLLSLPTQGPRGSVTPTLWQPLAKGECSHGKGWTACWAKRWGLWIRCRREVPRCGELRRPCGGWSGAVETVTDFPGFGVDILLGASGIFQILSEPLPEAGVGALGLGSGQCVSAP